MAQGGRDNSSRGAWPCSRAVIALVLASALLPTGGARAAPPSETTAAAPAAASADSKCDRAKFRIILDVGHTAESYGAMSARGVPEFEFNLNLGKRIDERLKADGFAETVLLVTEGKARPSLMKRVARANKKGADLFLSIHHDSVPGIYAEKWEFEGKKSIFNDLFGGYSVFVSRQNPHYQESLRFARLVGNQMASKELQFARQYDQWFMGKFQRELLDIEAGVYRYDQLIVLKMTSMPAVLLESGSIINREEELVMASDDHKNKVAAAVSAAALEYCGTRGPASPQVAQPPPKSSKPAQRVAQPRVVQPKKPAAARAAQKR
ncbi:N-acetylmuramoyl-L-alanine amidase [Bradyrhizobium sp.]|uniref:N-acetylmuramoyl-L-alanine amidase family protein n=1 Tax=Bradyrhizobium sp. TaxID=376 RepID=UPI001DA38EF4|nr:N-acetylmuramoyl-L-alanine amidase [Bradyrhizobium sp.]MBI5320710.1 N-acetylmuramoyl-L-alanine amidase [Bradyrhizobium sp.]